MTPGRYLSLRRQAAGLAVDGLALDVAAVEAIEGGDRAPTDIELQALAWAFPFDQAVLIGLARGITERLCRACGCSQNDACVEPCGNCYWIEHDLCSSCAETDRATPEGMKA